MCLLEPQLPAWFKVVRIPPLLHKYWLICVVTNFTQSMSVSPDLELFSKSDNFTYGCFVIKLQFWQHFKKKIMICGFCQKILQLIEVCYNSKQLWKTIYVYSIIMTTTLCFKFSQISNRFKFRFVNYSKLFPIQNNFLPRPINGESL